MTPAWRRFKILCVLALYPVMALAATTWNYFPVPGITYNSSTNALGIGTPTSTASSLSLGNTTGTLLTSPSLTLNDGTQFLGALLSTDDYWLLRANTSAPAPTGIGISIGDVVMQSGSGATCDVSGGNDSFCFGTPANVDGSLGMRVDGNGASGTANLNVWTDISGTGLIGGFGCTSDGGTLAANGGFLGINVPLTNAPTVAGCVVGGQSTNTNLLLMTRKIGAAWIDGSQNIVSSVKSNAVGDTNGYFYLRQIAGVPTGVPANLTGYYANAAPLTFDKTDNRLYAYNAGWINLSPGALASNNVWTGTNNFDGASNPTTSLVGVSVGVQSAISPTLQWNANTGTTDKNLWEAFVNGSNGCWFLAVQNDAASVVSTALQICRTAAAVTTESFGNATDNPTYSFLGTGLLTLPRHVAANGSAPVVSACGTGPSIDAHATDFSGTVTVGTVAAASCTITFNATFATWNHCRVTAQSTLAAFAYSYTLSAITVTGTSLVSAKIDYQCDGS